MLPSLTWLLLMLSSSLILYALRRWKIISFTVQDSHTVLVSMESIRGISVPMYTTLRRTSVVFTVMAEYFLSRKKYSSQVVACVGIIMLGAFVAGARDLSFDYYSYTIVVISNTTTAIYLACISSIAYRDDLEATRNFPYLYTAGFQAVIFLSCALAFLLNYCIFLNTTINSALTQRVCGNLKDLFTVGFGWIVFRELPFDLLNIVGQCLSFLDLVCMLTVNKGI
ncbi:hypothetical protein K7X08_003961 [Anisodus acutangulus]|uniref:Uncharacterized protein n=1 Tax=Anisodus acutangulus TaxID=402998 RepID=A0A9Q1RH03_9SOLA|nr:hypothetical protein K7X08_003961 [Anisodus acutangulus]